MIPGVTSHARERMVERHGRDLTRAEWLAVVLDILDGRATLLRIGSAGDTYAVQLGAMTLRIVWRVDWCAVATVLPEGSSLTQVSTRPVRKL